MAGRRVKGGMKRRAVLVGAGAVLVPLNAGAQTVGARQNEAAMPSSENEFGPGDRVPATGIYIATHDKLDGEYHAAPHPVTATAGSVFPPCRVCGEGVAFRPQQAAVPIESHHHFKI